MGQLKTQHQLKIEKVDKKYQLKVAKSLSQSLEQVVLKGKERERENDSSEAEAQRRKLRKP